MLFIFYAAHGAHAALTAPCRHKAELQGHAVSLHTDLHCPLNTSLLSLLQKTALVFLQETDAFLTASLTITPQHRIRASASSSISDHHSTSSITFTTSSYVLASVLSYATAAITSGFKEQTLSNLYEGKKTAPKKEKKQHSLKCY